MKKLLFISSIFFVVQLFSQDYIMLRNGDEIKSKVLEINQDNIKYKKYSNLSGPTYTIEKSEVFIIKYASGDKDVFNAVENGTVRKSTGLFSSSGGEIYDGNLGNKNCQVQRERGAKIFGDKAAEVFFRGDLVWYGYDMTYLRLSNPKKLGDGMSLVQKYFNDWNNEFNKNAGFENFQRWMDKPYMIKGTPIFQNYYQRDFNDFVIYGNYCLSIEDLQQIIRSYNLNEVQGIGMVINLVNFNKEREYSMQYITFFDIETREIVYAVLTTGPAGGSGMVGHWATGVEDGVRKIFIDEIYKKKVYNNGMIPSKLRLY